MTPMTLKSFAFAPFSRLPLFLFFPLYSFFFLFSSLFLSNPMPLAEENEGRRKRKE
jgi:hypothetical protein